MNTEKEEPEESTFLSLRGGSGSRDAAIHGVLRVAKGFVCSITEDQWIATGLRPRDDKGEGGRLQGRTSNLPICAEIIPIRIFSLD